MLCFVPEINMMITLKKADQLGGRGHDIVWVILVVYPLTRDSPEKGISEKQE